MSLKKQFETLHTEVSACFSAGDSDGVAYALNLLESSNHVLSPALDKLPDPSSFGRPPAGEMGTDFIEKYELYARMLEKSIVPALEASLSRSELHDLAIALSSALDALRMGRSRNLSPSQDAKTPPHRLDLEVNKNH
jgi:hypothetical protein